MSHIKKILQAENLPSWIGLLSIVAVIFTLKNGLSRSEIEAEKLNIVSRFTETTIPIGFSEFKNNPKKLQAMSELVSDGLAVQTALGYESSRFDPRLKDDIQVSVSLVLAKHQPGAQSFAFPSTCDEVDLLQTDVSSMVMKLEELRGGRVGTEFKEYLNAHRDAVLRQLFYATDRNKTDYELALKCF